jgi:predicted ATPase
MITKARFVNYKTLKDVTIDFESPLTVIVGPNGCGKSSVLRCLQNMIQLASNKNFQAHVEWHKSQYRHTFCDDSTIQPRHQSFEIWEGREGIRHTISDKSDIPHRKNSHAMTELVSHLTVRTLDDRSVRESVNGLYLQEGRFSSAPSEMIELRASQLAAPSHTFSIPPLLSADGSGLASVLANFKLSDESKFNEIVSAFQQLIPQVSRIRITRNGILDDTDSKQTLGEEMLFDLQNRSGIRATGMSDGTLYALGLIVKILDPQRPKTLLIDDIDHGFHPNAQRNIVNLIHKLLQQLPDLQIIATSHSPYILDRLAPNQVRVMNLRDDGTAVCGRLADHPEFERWKDSMSPGEFWNYFGEDWLKDQQPTPQPVLNP